MESVIKIVRETEFYQGYIRFKMAVTNESPYAIMDVTLDFIYDDDLLHIDRHEPASLPAKQGKYILGNIDGGKSKSISVYFDPLMCTKGTDIGCQVIYKDYHGDLKLDQMEPKEITVVCPIIKTDSDINIGKLKQFIEELPHKDERIYEIQSGFNIQKIEKLAREVVEKRDVRHIRTLYSPDGKKCEMWYYGKTKVTTDNIVIRVSIQTADQTIELFAATQAAEALTGLLAEIGRNIKDAIESQVSGRGRVVNIAIDKSKITGNNLIDHYNDEISDVNSVLDKSKIDSLWFDTPNDEHRKSEEFKQNLGYRRDNNRTILKEDLFRVLVNKGWKNVRLNGEFSGYSFDIIGEKNLGTTYFLVNIIDELTYDNIRTIHDDYVDLMKKSKSRFFGAKYIVHWTIVNSISPDIRNEIDSDRLGIFKLLKSGSSIGSFSLADCEKGLVYGKIPLVPIPNHICGKEAKKIIESLM